MLNAQGKIGPGWMPVDAVVVDGRPGLLWMQMSDVTFSEPFFQQTIDRVRAENPDRPRRVTVLDARLLRGESIRSAEAAATIFRRSRCGWTLIRNACRRVNSASVRS